MVKKKYLTAIVDKSQFGQRLDQSMVILFPDYSRSRIKKWILSGCVQVNASIKNIPKTKVMGGETVTVAEEILESSDWEPQDISLNIVYEDNDILIINKPCDLVVHPGAGKPNGTLLNALLYYCPEITNVPRAGIVHRLDKNTTGLMVVAKTVQAHIRLVRAIKARSVIREYEAVAIGIMNYRGTVDAPISRHLTKRTQMAVRPIGKQSVTHYHVIEYFRSHTRIRLRLETGRTHQIRVHMSHINHPLVGDLLYGGRPRFQKGTPETLLSFLLAFNRQALHATLLRFCHPISGVKIEKHAPLPQDVLDLITILRSDYEEFKNNIYC